VLFFSIVGIAAGFFTYGIPSYKSFFWTSDLLVVLFSFFLADMFFLFTHEFTHFCVTKAVGGEAVMRIGYRYIYLVAETESYHLGVVTKKQRYLVYLSGSIMDLLIVGLIYWFLLATRVLGFTIGQGYNFLIAIILLELIAVIWQFDAFLETDMYNFLSEYLGIENLRNDALKYISLHTKKWKKILFFPIKRLLLFFAKDYTVSSDDLRLLNKSDKRKLFIYVLFLIAGIVFTTLEYIFYTIPALFTFISTVSTDIIRTTQHFDLISLTKSSLVMVLITYQYFLLLYLRIRKKKTS
jgi:hypothetical protein